MVAEGRSRGDTASARIVRCSAPCGRTGTGSATWSITPGPFRNVHPAAGRGAAEGPGGGRGRAGVTVETVSLHDSADQVLAEADRGAYATTYRVSPPRPADVVAAALL